MPLALAYDRIAAIQYAKKWAYGRNPNFFDYEEIGGDCTNFASQCLFAGTGIMNFTPNFGWYYINANQKSPAWTGVEYFRNFLIRKEKSAGPFAIETGLYGLHPGDFVQLNFNGERFSHTPIVIQINHPITAENIFVAAHSYDAYMRPLSTYEYQDIRCIHILGAYPPDGMIYDS